MAEELSLHEYQELLYVKFTDKIILKRSEHLFDCFCQFDRNKNKVIDIRKQSLELDEAISLQKKYFLKIRIVSLFLGAPNGLPHLVFF